MSGKHQAPGRVVLGLWHTTADAASIEAAAELARLLRLGLHGLFVEDEALLTMAALPFAREIRLATHTWRELSADAVETEMRHAAEEAQRLLDAAARATGIASAFEVVRGDPAACIAAACRAGDILAVTDPGAAGLAAHGGLRLREDAGEAASILLLPARPAARRGSIVAIAQDAADPALAAAGALAAATGEDLVLLLAQGTAPDAARAMAASVQEAGRTHRRVATRIVHGSGSENVLEAMAGLRERLIVIARAAPLAAAGARLAAVRGVPVLLAGEDMSA
jgi:hypothetical protein